MAALIMVLDNGIYALNVSVIWKTYMNRENKT